MSQPLHQCEYQVGIQHYPPHEVVTCPNTALPGTPFCAHHTHVKGQPPILIITPVAMDHRVPR